MSQFYKLPFLSNESFPSVEYSKAAACRAPIKDAINAARAMNPDKMVQVIDILQFAINHIRNGVPEDEPQTEAVTDVPVSSDPLDCLLGPAKTELDAS